MISVRATDEQARARSGAGACTLAALLSIVAPGLGHRAVRAARTRLVVLAASINVVACLVAGLVVASATDRTGLAEVVADRPRFVAFGAALVLLAATRVWAAVHSAWLARPATGVRLQVLAAGATALLVVLGVAPLVVAADQVWSADRALEAVFATDDAVTAYPGAVSPAFGSTRNATLPSAPVPATTLALPATTLAGDRPVPTSTTVAATTTAAPTTTTTLPPMVGEDRVNVLLLGGDAGPGRWSLRTDSMVVISIDPVTGDTAMISVPRNLARLPFPPGTALAKKYPRGFDDIANAVYPYVNQHRELAGGGEDAGAQAVKLGMAQLLGLPIHYYVLVDMRGFVDVVNALGGIDIDVPQRVPSPGNPADADHPVPAWIEAGQQHMDGTLALTYARSRSADSDYQRMGRQRCVLAGIAEAATPMAIATGLPDLVSAFGEAFRTDIPRDRLDEFAALLDQFTVAGGITAVRTLHLAPPLVNSRTWDALKVRLLVAATITSVAQSSPAPATTSPAPVLADSC